MPNFYPARDYFISLRVLAWRFLSKPLLSVHSITHRYLSNEIGTETNQQNLRINRCLPHLSRRDFDRLIRSKRVFVNGTIAKVGMRLKKGDSLVIDGKEQYWENYLLQQHTSLVSKNNEFVYIKYWKSRGISTNDVLSQAEFQLKNPTFRPLSNARMSNDGKPAVIYHTASAHCAGVDSRQPEWEHNQYMQDRRDSSDTHSQLGKNVPLINAERLMPVGRLDKDSSGLILFTSDRRLIGALLGRTSEGSKVYEVQLSQPASASDLRRWAAGVSITTRNTTGKFRTHPTLPCGVRLLPQAPLRSRAKSGRGGGRSNSNNNRNDSGSLASAADGSPLCWVEFTLCEGRNRQVRRMVAALGHTVLQLHRTQFCGLSLAGLGGPGDWAYLSQGELKVLSSLANL